MNIQGNPNININTRPEDELADVIARLIDHRAREIAREEIAAHEAKRNAELNALISKTLNLSREADHGIRKNPDIQGVVLDGVDELGEDRVDVADGLAVVAGVDPGLEVGGLVVEDLGDGSGLHGRVCHCSSPVRSGSDTAMSGDLAMTVQEATDDSSPGVVGGAGPSGPADSSEGE